jgi:large subunit ribosomal protein L21
LRVSTGLRKEGAVFAIIRSGGRQYRVEAGQTILVERLPLDAGKTLQIEDVLLVGDGEKTQVGTPRVSGASVEATVLEQGRAAKVRVLKYKKRKHYRLTRGHRQAYTALRIERIQA